MNPKLKLCPRCYTMKNIGKNMIICNNCDKKEASIDKYIEGKEKK